MTAKRITDTTARALPIPAKGYALHWCPVTPGFGVRVTAAGARAWIAQRRVGSKTVRRTLGKVSGAAAISADAARRLQLDVSSELQNGRDRLEERREARKAERADALTFERALREYVEKKRRAKDGKPLKVRTKADYLAMVEPAGTTKTGKPTRAGELWSIAKRSIWRLTAQDIRDLHAELADRGERRQTYAMQVTRAVLRFFGVTIEGNPLSPTTAGAKRVTLAPSRGNPTAIPSHRLAVWWAAACAIDTLSADQLRFELLVGCRPGEVSTVRVRQFDHHARTVTFLDTKNRLDHVALLSRQAFEIAAKHAKGKRLDDPLFGVADTGKTLQAINAASGVSKAITPHKLRHTFATVADELVPGRMLRALLNHTSGEDTADVHYIDRDRARLRAAWQTVADHITGAAA